MSVEAPVIEVAPPIARRRARTQINRRHLRAVAIAGGIAGCLVIGLAISASAHNRVSPSQVGDDDLDDEPVTLRGAVSAHEPKPPVLSVAERLADDHPIPDVDGTPLSELYPSLAHWIHPITRAGELMPANPGRHFGAARHGVDRTECGEGHCGIDLDGPFGRALVAVAPGVVVHVERRELGADGRSGRFVRIQHDDGTLTSYMHMEEIEDGLEIGDHVIAGQYIGTLGKSAVEVAHLHFSLEIPNHRGSRDTNFASTHFVDPAPFLVRAQVVDTAERHRAVKPAM